MKTLHSISNRPIAFSQLPQTYQELCTLHLPRPIHDHHHYQETTAIADLFAGFEEKMNEDQHDYFEILCGLIEEYEAIHSPRVSAKKRLKHLLEESNTSASKLASILDLERSVGVRIVNGERNLTLEHVRKLSRYFKLEPGFFIYSQIT